MSYGSKIAGSDWHWQIHALDEKVCFEIGFQSTSLCDLLLHSKHNGFEQELYVPFLHEAHWHEIPLATLGNWRPTNTTKENSHGW